MRIFVIVKPRKKEGKVAPPVDNKANEAVIKILGVHFDLPKWKIQLISSQSSRKKIVDVGK